MNWGSPSVADASGQAANDLSKLDALWQGPSLAGESPFWGGFADAHLAFAGAFGQFCFSFWIFAVVGLVGAFIVSFYYSASTLIYLLLRREVDATDLEDVYLEEQPEDPSPPVEATEPPKQDEAGDSSPSEDKPTS